MRSNYIRRERKFVACFFEKQVSKVKLEVSQFPNSNLDL